MTSPERLKPATADLPLDFNAGEDIDHQLLVTDRDGVPVPLVSAVATIGLPGCPTQHTWSVAAGNLALSDEVGVVELSTTAEQTAEWLTAWGDSEWRLTTVDVFGKRKIPCGGDVRVLPTGSGAT